MGRVDVYFFLVVEGVVVGLLFNILSGDLVVVVVVVLCDVGLLLIFNEDGWMEVEI